MAGENGGDGERQHASSRADGETSAADTRGDQAGLTRVEPAVPAAWAELRRFTPARIATGRSGGSLPTAEVLRFAGDHAFARDAVHAELDLNGLERGLARLELPVLRVETCAGDRLRFIEQPDLGRRLSSQSCELLKTADLRAKAADVVVVISAGLSAAAAQLHAAPLLLELLPRLDRAGLSIGPLVVVRHGRVALQDEIGELLGAKSGLILLGERPGLSASDSLGAYFVYGPRVGNTDADRNCVSNIRPDGLPIRAAAETLEYLITTSVQRRLSGTALKDERAPGKQLNFRG